MNPAIAFVAMLEAAMKDGATGKVVQLQATNRPEGAAKSELVRIIIVPDHGPLRTDPKSFLDKLVDAIEAAGQKGAHTQIRAPYVNGVQIVVIPEKLQFEWPRWAPLGTPHS